MNAKPTKAVPMACLTIGYHDYLMPADKAMKVADLMQSAFECDKDWTERDHVYQAKEQPRVEFAFVKPHQVRQPAPAQKPRLLPGSAS